MDYQKICLPHLSKTKILALGGQAKSSFCIVKNGTAYVSETGNDLGSLENLAVFEKEIRKIQKNLKFKPDIIACDLHPEYTSTKLADDWVRGKRCKVKGVQHHEAHVASCMVDNKIKGNVIGAAFDGTGFGLDGNIWGGEFFTGNIKGFKRRAHLRYVPMPGGESAVKEPRRMALSYLYSIYASNLANLTRLDKKSIKLIAQIIDKKINSPLTSSMGRLFDAVSSIAGICDVAEYEGQAAVELEKAINKAQGSRLKAQGKYKFKYKDDGDMLIIDWGDVIKGVVKDVKARKDKSLISLRFHNAVCDMIKDVCVLLRKKYNIYKVCLSGGVFQNKYLRNNVKPVLEAAGFDVYCHKRVPPHDGNIALGQAVLACV
jgi:hydrogenase maturation protein HypF